jgi:hypothetical protein
MAGEPGFFDENPPDAGPEEDAPSDLFGAAAEAGERRGIGRPKGARNRKTEAFEAWYFARFKDPAVFLGELVTMDARALAELVLEDAVRRGLATKDAPGILDVVKLQQAAAGELMPFLHGKKPIDVNVAAELLPTLIIAAGLNQVDQARLLAEAKAMSVGAPLVDAEANEIKDLEGGG